MEYMLKRKLLWSFKSLPVLFFKVHFDKFAHDLWIVFLSVLLLFPVKWQVILMFYPALFQPLACCMESWKPLKYYLWFLVPRMWCTASKEKSSNVKSYVLVVTNFLQKRSLSISTKPLLLVYTVPARLLVFLLHSTLKDAQTVRWSSGKPLDFLSCYSWGFPSLLQKNKDQSILHADGCLLLLHCT